jgi:hypothetical protein
MCSFPVPSAMDVCSMLSNMRHYLEAYAHGEMFEHIDQLG